MVGINDPDQQEEEGLLSYKGKNTCGSLVIPLEASGYVIGNVEGHVPQFLPEKGIVANKHTFSLRKRIWVTSR